MTIQDFDPVPALIGGVLIGGASALAMSMTGKVPGISGITSRLMKPVRGDTVWRALFLVGLIGGAGLTFWLWPPSAAFGRLRPLPWMVAAGLLVGFGTRLSGGCTSGHGVCGIGRRSWPSIGATLVFMATGVATVYVVDHLLAGGAS